MNVYAVFSNTRFSRFVSYPLRFKLYAMTWTCLVKVSNFVFVAKVLALTIIIILKSLARSPKKLKMISLTGGDMTLL